MLIAVSTCDGFSFPLAHAEPVETAKPSRSITTTQRRRQSGCSGMMTDEVFQSRGASAPSTRAVGNAEQSSFSKSSRHAARLLVVDIAASRSSSAATIARIPATFSVPARRPFSCGPPRSKGEKPRGHFKNPTPCGPPNLCAQPLTKSHSPSPRAGSFPIHCAASQKNSTRTWRQSLFSICHGCCTPVSLFAAMTAISAGCVRVSSVTSHPTSTTPEAKTGTVLARRGDSKTHGCSIAETQISLNCVITVFADSVAPLVKTISSAEQPRSFARRPRASSSAVSALCPSRCGDEAFAENFSTASSQTRFAVAEMECVAL